MEKRYYIYQLPPSESQYMTFVDEYTEVSINDYCAVYTDVLSDLEVTQPALTILNYLFTKFNIDRPENFAAHSLSVGDIIKLDKDYYLCMSEGWKKLF